MCYRTLVRGGGGYHRCWTLLLSLPTHTRHHHLLTTTSQTYQNSREIPVERETHGDLETLDERQKNLSDEFYNCSCAPSLPHNCNVARVQRSQSSQVTAIMMYYASRRIVEPTSHETHPTEGFLVRT